MGTGAPRASTVVERAISDSQISITESKTRVAKGWQRVGNERHVVPVVLKFLAAFQAANIRLRGRDLTRHSGVVCRIEIHWEGKALVEATAEQQTN